MGTFTVRLEVADPQARRYEIVKAIVDPGATYTALPVSILERLGVVPHGTRRFVLADGRRVELGFGRTWMRLDGREEISPVVFQEEGAQPLLGAVTLETLGLGIDPVNGRLIPVDAFMRRWRPAELGQEPSDGTGSDETAGLTPSAAKLQRILGPSRAVPRGRPAGAERCSPVVQ